MKNWSYYTHNHNELLSTVLQNKWYTLDTRFTLGEEDIQIVKDYHQWLTGETLTFQPSVDPPNCLAVLTHWRVFSTIINVSEKSLQMLVLRARSCH